MRLPIRVKSPERNIIAISTPSRYGTGLNEVKLINAVVHNLSEVADHLFIMHIVEFNFCFGVTIMRMIQEEICLFENISEIFLKIWSWTATRFAHHWLRNPDLMTSLYHISDFCFSDRAKIQKTRGKSYKSNLDLKLKYISNWSNAPASYFKANIVLFKDKFHQ